MKIDRETILVVVIAAIAILLWQPFMSYMGWDAVPAAATTTLQESASTADSDSLAAAPRDAKIASDAPKAAVEPKILNLSEQVLENEAMRLTFAPGLGILTKVELLNYYTSGNDKEHIVLDNYNGIDGNKVKFGALSVFDRNEFEVIEVLDNSKLTGADGTTYTLKRKMKKADGQMFILVQNWTLKHNLSYTVAYNVTLTNLGKTMLKFDALTVSGGDLQPWKIISGDKVRSESYNIDYYTTGNQFNSIGIDSKDAKFYAAPESRSIQWVGLTNKYFATVLRSEQPFELFKERFEIVDKDEKYFRAVGGAVFPDLVLAPNEQKSLNFSYYTGPKIIYNLKEFDPSATDLMHLSWGPLNFLSEILLKVLMFLHNWFSYGVSIIILTILVRLLFWPITQKANASMKKMQRVQPMIKELREKYKGDQPTLNAKMMELYRTEKINPLGGCLPILLQIPVFFALYATLDGAVQLRQVPFLWAHDLASADTVGHVFGLAINPLVLAMTGLMVLQQKLTPSTMEPMQQKMMMIMPVVMLFVLYDLPSGLTLYWTVSQIFSIIQLWWQRRDNSKAGAVAAK